MTSWTSNAWSTNWSHSPFTGCCPNLLPNLFSCKYGAFVPITKLVYGALLWQSRTRNLDREILRMPTRYTSSRQEYTRTTAQPDGEFLSSAPRLIRCPPSLLPTGGKEPSTHALNRPWHEDRSPPTSAEVNNVWSYTFTFKCVFTAWCSVN
jgi:hypothetical protein